MPPALFFLALAVFAMGTSEFMLAGLLPDISASLDVPLGTAGLLTSAFAIGMIIGAPVMAALARRWPLRISLVIFLLAFAGVHVIGALTSSFTVMVITRLVAALANAGFLAVALGAATALVAPDQKGRALAVLLSGTTAATIFGVPGGAALGAFFGWRTTFWLVAALCLPVGLGIICGVRPSLATPDRPADRPPLRTELALLTEPRLVTTMLLAALVNGATFATFTYLAPITSAASGLTERWVPVVLVIFGLGSFGGVNLAGRLADRRPDLVIVGVGPALLAGWITLALLADRAIALLPLAFVIGLMSFALGSTLITRILYRSGGAPTMGGSYATAALNVGAAAGPIAAGLTLRTDQLGPVWVSAALVVTALVIMAVSFGLTRRAV